jgi:hypothetical protein
MQRDTHRAFNCLEDQDRSDAGVRIVEQSPMRAIGMIAGGSAVIVIEVRDVVLADDGGRAKLDLATKMAAEIFGMTKMTKREEFEFENRKPH